MFSEKEVAKFKRLEELENAEYQIECEEKKDKARNGLLNFTRYTMPEYEVNWHHRALCKKLNQFEKKEIRFLMIFMPPRHGKSEIGSIRLPAYILGRNPDAKILAASYNATLASHMVVQNQRVMDTEAYRDLFPESIITPEGQKTKFARNSEMHEIINRKGLYRGQGVGGSFTGLGADYIIVDDPIKGRESADSPAFRKAVYDWYTGVLRTRLEKNGSILLIMTRWHQDDLAGRLLQKMKEDNDADKWEVFSLPAVKEKEGNPLDKRKIGEPLWVNKYDASDLKALKASSARDWQALFQQEPTSDEGSVILRKWIRFYKELPPRPDEYIQSWDFTFKDAKDSAKVSGQVWARHGVNKYLIDDVNDRMGFIASVNAMLSLSAKHPKAYTKLVEEKANGAAIIDTLKDKLSGMVPINPEGTKDARLWAIQSEFEAGNIYFPDPSIAPWVHDFIEEIVGFPTAKFRDRVDAMSQALARLRESGNATFTKEHIPNKIKTITASIRGAETW